MKIVTETTKILSSSSSLKPSTTTKQPSPKRKESSVPAGTIIKGVNFYKNGSDPVAKLDEEYPDWLWELLDEEVIRQKELEQDKFSRKSHRRDRREKIKNDNFDRDRKN